MKRIQVGFLVSYDYYFLKNSIPLVYSDADDIFLALDSNQKTWGGETINIPDSFFKWIEDYDHLNKITIYRDNFSNPNISTMECEIIERKKLAEKMGIGNWIIQLDADEYFIHFNKFVRFLKKRNHLLNHPHKTPVQIYPFHVNLYKKTDNGYFIVNNATKTVVATNYPDYTLGRKTNGRIIYVNFLMIHECLSRNKQDLITKLNSWGHNKEVNIKEFIGKWDSINEENYTQMKDFFFLEASKWKKLVFIRANTLEDFIKEFSLNYEKKLYKSDFFIQAKNIARKIKHNTDNSKKNQILNPSLKKLNILHVSSNIIWSGSEKQVINIIDNINESNASNTIFCYENTSTYKKSIQKGVNTYTISKTKVNFVSRLIALKKCISTNNIDLIYIHTSEAFSNLLLSDILIKLKTPIIFSKKELNPKVFLK